MNDKELAIRLIQLGVANQSKDTDRYTEANSDPDVRDAGNAAVANALEFLGKHSIVNDVQPTLGQGGIGFAYKIASNLLLELSSEQAVVQLIQSLFAGATTETSSTLAILVADCERVVKNSVYRDDLLTSLKELRVCFDNACYIACMALSGKILEICLKQMMIDYNIPFDDGAMLGLLLKKITEANFPKYIDTSLVSIGNIINQSRIPAVHAKEKIPVPSKEQAIMVIHAVVDTVKKTLIAS